MKLQIICRVFPVLFFALLASGIPLAFALGGPQAKSPSPQFEPIAMPIPFQWVETPQDSLVVPCCNPLELKFAVKHAKGRITFAYSAGSPDRDMLFSPLGPLQQEPQAGRGLPMGSGHVPPPTQLGAPADPREMSPGDTKPSRPGGQSSVTVVPALPNEFVLRFAGKRDKNLANSTPIVLTVTAEAAGVVLTKTVTIRFVDMFSRWHANQGERAM